VRLRIMASGSKGAMEGAKTGSKGAIPYSFCFSINFQGAPWPKPAIEDREEDRFEHGFARRVKRTVDDHIRDVLISRHWTATAASEDAGRRRLS
jgi:hypothetical protein